MAPEKKTEEVVQDWLLTAKADLECAELLYNGKKYSQALYCLQQSNEKLAKGLLISFGILTPKVAKKDQRIKSLLGFTPKQPQAYRHNITHSFVSDIEKMVPSIEQVYKLIIEAGLDPQIIHFKNTIQNSKKGLQTLKKKPFCLIENDLQLQNEILAANHILSALDSTMDKVNEEIDNLNFAEIVRVAHNIAGIPPTTETMEDYSQKRVKNNVVSSLNISILTTLSVAMASFLDPLEAVTRYPDSANSRFDETNPYVKQFKQIQDLIASTLERSEKMNEKAHK